jgi:hypothetical protein
MLAATDRNLVVVRNRAGRKGDDAVFCVMSLNWSSLFDCLVLCGESGPAIIVSVSKSKHHI